jgi:hypothetical protein
MPPRLPVVVPTLSADRVPYDDLDADKVEAAHFPVITTCGKYLGILTDKLYQSGHTGTTETYRTLQLDWIRVTDGAIEKTLPLLSRSDTSMHAEFRAGACAHGEEACDPRIGEPNADAAAAMAQAWAKTRRQRTEAILGHVRRFTCHALEPVLAADAKEAAGTSGWRLYTARLKGGLEVTVKHSATAKILATTRLAFKDQDFQSGDVGYSEAWLSEPLGVLLVKAAAFNPSRDISELHYQVVRIGR